MASKEQSVLYDKLVEIAPNLKFIQDYRPGFLLNKTTGKNFEIDIYCEEYKFGFEYQGAIHFKHISKYKNNPDKSRLHDVYKSSIIDEIHGKLSVIEIFEQDLTGDIKTNICERIYNTAYFYLNRDISKFKYLIFLYLCMKYSIGNGFTFSYAHMAIYDDNKMQIKHSDNLMAEKKYYIDLIKKTKRTVIKKIPCQ